MKTAQNRTILFLLAISFVAFLSAPFQIEANEDGYLKGKKHYDAKEYEKALPFFQEAAKQGHVDAMTHLGKMNYNGWGIKHNHELAKEWHEKAAKLGSKESQKKLHNMEKGHQKKHE